MPNSDRRPGGAGGRLRLWLLLWSPWALALTLALVVIPNPSGRWSWTYGSEGTRSPWLTGEALVGQAVPAPGRPFSRVGVRFRLGGAKTDGQVRVVLLQGAAPPAGEAEIKRRTLASATRPHKSLRGDRFFRLRLEQLAAGDSGLYLVISLASGGGKPKLGLWLDRSPDWRGQAARLLTRQPGGRLTPAAAPLAGHLSLEIGRAGTTEPLGLALLGRWWGVPVLLLLYLGGLALLVLLAPDPATLRRQLLASRRATLSAWPRWPAAERRTWLPVVLVACALFGALLFQTAWVSDDIYLTLRSVANLVAGDGPIWNPGERVQAFTHPLWMFLLSVGVLLTGSGFAAALGLGLILSCVCLLLLAFRAARCGNSALLGVAMLGVSMAFIDFSTSGLENPLLHLLLLLFAVIYLDGGGDTRDTREGALLKLWLLFSLAALTRLDAALLFAPALAAAAWAHLRPALTWPRVAAHLRLTLIGLGPLLAWLLFATFYYGTPLPNTAFAKLGAGIPRLDLVRQGELYLLNSLAWDPATLVIIVTAAAVPLLAGDRRLFALVGGAWLYVGYTVWIGGCFMSGRFLTGPLLLSALVWARLPLRGAAPAVVIAAALVAVSLGTRFGVPGVAGGRAVARFSSSGISDERAFYFHDRGLLSISRDRDLADAPESTAAAPVSSSACGGAGQASFLRGTDAYILDPCALGDAFLARIPALGAYNAKWRIGHFVRSVPGGYAQTLTSRQNLLISGDLSAYYERLRAVISWDLLDSGRLAWLARLAAGADEGLLGVLDAVDTDLAAISTVRAQGSPWNADGVTVMGQGGLYIDLKELRFSRRLALSLNNDARYRLYFLRNARHAGHRVLGPSKGKGLVHYTVEVPEEIRKRGYDLLYLMPLMGKRNFSLGHLELK